MTSYETCSVDDCDEAVLITCAFCSKKNFAFMISSSIIIFTVKVLVMRTNDLFSPVILPFCVLDRTTEIVLQLGLFW